VRRGPDDWRDDLSEQRSMLDRWARCTGYGTIGCVVGAIRFGGAAYTALKLASLIDAPGNALGLLTFCLTAEGIACLGSL
jgi:hypothetical protein